MTKAAHARPAVLARVEVSAASLGLLLLLGLLLIPSGGPAI